MISLKRIVFIFALMISIAKSQDNINLKCLDSKSHKPHPTPTSDLFGYCSKWKDMSCCTKTTTETFHADENWQGFNFNHCGTISDECKNYFLKELCFYECDPYLGNWIVGDSSKKMRKERYYQVPLCYSDCNNWFNACKYDFTCRDDWSKGFKWINNTNFCHEYDKCDTFANKFRTAENFCNKIWDEEFIVDKNETNCFTFEFEENNPNPNKRIAQLYAQTNLGSSIKYNVFILVLFALINLIFLK